MLATSKTDLLKELKRRVEDKILEPTNYELLKKLIEKADTLDEAIMITELGTTYKRTGFHFDKRLEKLSDTIKYFKKNDALSFETDPSKKHHKLGYIRRLGYSKSLYALSSKKFSKQAT